LWENLRSGQSAQEMKEAIPEEFWGDFDRIVGLLEPQVEALKAQIRELHLQTAHLSNKEIGLATDVPVDLKSFLFNLRKEPDCLDRHGKELERLYDRVRPAGNRLAGYMPSSAMERVLDR
jgi:RNA ligase